MATGNTNLSPAARRKEKLRHHIMEVAAKLYVENGGEDGGFEATTIEAIAEGADISVRSFFRYFESKADVIFLDKRRAVNDLILFVGRRLESETPIKAVIDGSLEQVDYFVSDPLNAERLRRSLLSEQFRERLAIWREDEKRALAELIKTHLGRSGGGRTGARIVAATIRDIVHEGLANWAEGENKSASAAILEACDMLPGISAEVSVAAKVWASNVGDTGRKPRKTTRRTG